MLEVVLSAKDEDLTPATSGKNRWLTCFKEVNPQVFITMEITSSLLFTHNSTVVQKIFIWKNPFSALLKYAMVTAQSRSDHGIPLECRTMHLATTATLLHEGCLCTWVYQNWGIWSLARLCPFPKASSLFLNMMRFLLLKYVILGCPSGQKVWDLYSFLDDMSSIFF